MMFGKFKINLDFLLNNKKIILILGVFLIIILIIFLINNKKEIVIIEEQQEEVAAESMENFVPESIFNLTGTIEEIGKNFIVFNASVPKINSSGKKQNFSEIRTAMINESTKIIRYALRTNQSTGKKEVIEEKFKLSDLKIGDKIEVMADKDIKYLKEFLAIKIRIL